MLARGSAICAADEGADVNKTVQCFHVVVADDEKDAREVILQQFKEQRICSEFVEIHDVKNYDQWASVWKARDGRYDRWIVITDCDFEKGGGTSGRGAKWDGFKIWRDVTLEQTKCPDAFVRLFSKQSDVVDMLSAAHPAAEHMNPRIYESSSGGLKNATECIQEAVRFIRQQRQAILRRIEMTNRKECIKAIRCVLAAAAETGPEVATLFEAEVWEGIRPWSLATLFPIEAAKIAESSDSLEIVEVLQSIRRELTRRLSPLVVELSRFLMYDLSDHQWRHVLQKIRPEQKLDHVLDLLRLPGADRSTWRGVYRQVLDAIEFYRNDIDSVIDNDLPKSLQGLAKDDLLSALRSTANAIDDVGAETAINAIRREGERAVKTWCNIDGKDWRRLFVEYPVLQSMVTVWRSVLESQRVKYGGGHLPTSNIEWYYADGKPLVGLYQTQMPDLGQALEPEQVQRALAEQAGEVQANKLSGICETVCGQLGGTLVIAQGPHVGRSIASEGTMALCIDASSIEVTSGWTSAQEEATLRRKLLPRNNSQLSGTWYLIIIPPFCGEPK